jgi:hypothetical protein
MNLTTYRLDSSNGVKAYALVYRTEEEARQWKDRLGTEAHVLAVTATVAVGDAVEVRAFGRMRPGHVITLGRTKVTVRYARNAAGDQATRTFGPGEVRVPGATVTTDLDAQP